MLFRSVIVVLGFDDDVLLSAQVDAKGQRSAHESLRRDVAEEKTID